MTSTTCVVCRHTAPFCECGAMESDAERERHLTMPEQERCKTCGNSGRVCIDRGDPDHGTDASYNECPDCSGARWKSGDLCDGIFTLNDGTEYDAAQLISTLGVERDTYLSSLREAVRYLEWIAGDDTPAAWESVFERARDTLRTLTDKHPELKEQS